MTDKEILDKVFKKVNKDLSLLDFESNDSNDDLLIYKYMFSHDFAKAFWGEVDVCSECGISIHSCSEDCYSNNNTPTMKSYKYHLQQMVLCKEPLKYLEKFL